LLFWLYKDFVCPLYMQEREFFFLFARGPH
jgi:hypothetical protein